MDYKTIRTIVAMSKSNAKPCDIAEEEYRLRIDNPATYHSGIVFDAHEIFATCVFNATYCKRSAKYQHY